MLSYVMSLYSDNVLTKKTEASLSLGVSSPLNLNLNFTLALHSRLLWCSQQPYCNHSQLSVIAPELRNPVFTEIRPYQFKLH